MPNFHLGHFALITSLAALLAGCSGIYVPSKGNVASQPPAVTACNRDNVGADQVYVCQGDTLSSLARRENVTVAGLKRANDLASNTIYTGTTLDLPDEYAYFVAEGDTLAAISQRTGVPVWEITAINNLRDPDRLTANTALAIPGRRTLVASATTGPSPIRNTAPVVVMTAPDPVQPDRTPPPVLAPPPVISTPDVTIGRQRTAPASNGPAASAPPASSQPEPSTVITPSATETPPSQTSAAPAAEQPAASAPAAAVKPRKRPTQVASAPATASPPPAATKPASSDLPAFLLPVEGKILSDFGPKSGGLHNDGINIAAPRGTPIRAAAEGTVAYAGDGLPGFGNLVLIKHGSGWTSAYAHADSLAVKRGDIVQRGQTIGTIGDTGSVNEPQLHFELRENDRAIDPKTLVR